jgi:hypothetical protein
VPLKSNWSAARVSACGAAVGTSSPPLSQWRASRHALSRPKPSPCQHHTKDFRALLHAPAEQGAPISEKQWVTEAEESDYRYHSDTKASKPHGPPRGSDTYLMADPAKVVWETDPTEITYLVEQLVQSLEISDGLCPTCRNALEGWNL